MVTLEQTRAADGASAGAKAAQPDQHMMLEAVRLLHPGRVVELRALNINRRGLTASGYFDQPQKLVEAALHYARRAEGLYITLNPLPPSLLSRTNNTLQEHARGMTSDHDVQRRAYLPIDLDPTRPSGIPSSALEHQAALDQARLVRAWLAERGWHAPIFADSGNGAHLLYAIDLPNDDQSTELLRRCLAALAARFNTPEVSLDQSVFNAARIWKLYGSLARKGEHRPERPHRLARLIEVPDPLEPVTRAQLEALADAASRTLPLAAPPTLAAGASGRVTEDALLAWLAARGAVVLRTKRDSGRVVFVLERCPFNPDHHEAGKACVTLSSAGSPGFKCQTAGCAQRNWRDLRDLWPDAPLAAAGDDQPPAASRDDLTLTPAEARAHLAEHAPALVSLGELMKQDFQPTLWVVPDLLPEGLTLLAAKPKLGKSWLALGLALAVASGGLALGKVQVEPGDVLYLALEDSPKRIHQRGKQLLRAQPAPERLELGTTWPRLDEGGLRWLEVWLQAHPDARLIILDTLAKIRGQSRGATLYGDDYASLEHVQKLAHQHNVAILVVHHTGKESREDPLDEVNATQGLNGVADNILVLRRERGKAQATLIGDGRELNGVEWTLSFDGTSGAWTRVEAPADQPKTPERAEILDVLKASAEPMSRKQIADVLGKHPNTVSTLLGRMVRDGDIKMVGYAKYTAVNSVVTVVSVNTSSPQENKKQFPSLFEKEDTTVTTLTTVTTPMQTTPPEAVEEGEAPSPAEPPADFVAFVDTAAQITHSRVAQISPLDDFSATMTPDALQPYTLVPSGLAPARRPRASQEVTWPIDGYCTGVFCEGNCVCGQHLCKDCACEAGMPVGHPPWFYDRREPRQGAFCEFCSATATVATRWKTQMCERCWMIASQGQGINPHAYQPRPFGPIEGDDDFDDDDS